MTSSGTVSGSCMCGAVRFEIAFPTRFCAHCHCSMCRRAHGAPMVTWVGVPLEQFRIVSGEDQLVVYHSSSAARRTFCRTCGCTLLFAGDRWPNEVHVARANIDGEIDRPVEAHCYWDARAPWLELADDLPRLGGPTGTKPLA